MNHLIDELKKFSPTILSLNDPVDINAVVKFEKHFEIKLPLDYKEFIQIHNGFTLCGTEVYGIFNSTEYSSIEGAYLYEHAHSLYPMPKYLMPFSPDGRGNHYCFDIRINDFNSSPIIFWQSGYKYTYEDEPEKTHDSFINFIEDVVIEWTLESYNYDGSEK